MREIKFKAWNKTQSRWEIDFHIEPDGSIWTKSRTASGGWAGSHRQNIEGRNEVILVQFTGLKDKNNKDIYEGDIISYTPFNAKGYEHSRGMVPDITAFHWFEELELMLTQHPNKCEIEVIGNIFENPELIP